MIDSDNIAEIKQRIQEKVDAAQKERDVMDSHIIEVHLPAFLKTKRQRPKDVNEFNKKTGERKADYYGNTYKRYKCFFDNFVKDYKFFNRFTIAQWKEDFVLGSTKKMSTYNNCLAILSTFSTYLVEEDVTRKKTVNTKYIRYRKTKLNHYPILDDETLENLLMQESDKIILDYIKMALLTGLRAQELVDLPTFKFCQIRLSVRGKSQKMRYLILKRRAKAHYDKIMKNPIKNTYLLNYHLKKFLELHEYPVLSFHSFRATYASKLYQVGTPLEKIARVLGHANIEMTMKYIQDLRHDNAVTAPNPYDKLDEDYNEDINEDAPLMVKGI